MRFDVAPNAAVVEGLSLTSLEVSASEQVLLRIMRSLPIPDVMMRVLGTRKTFAAVSRRLANSASGFCLVTCTEMSSKGDVLVGRAWQDAWLKFTEEGLAAQPMMALLVLQNILDNGPPEFFHRRDRESAVELVEQFRLLVQGSSQGHPAALMRFGYADAPQAQVGRLPLNRLIDETSGPSYDAA